MSLRAADLRFLLPAEPRTAALLPAEPALVAGLAAAGVRLVGPTAAGTAVDLAVVDRRTPAADVERYAPACVVVRGWPADARSWRRRGWQARRYLTAGGPRGPVLLALDTPVVRRYLARTWSRPTAALGRARNRLLAGPAGALAASLVVATREPGLPYPLAAALPATGGPACGWLLALRQGDDLQRLVATVFSEGHEAPSYVVKFSRLPGAPARGRVEQAVLRELAERAPELAGHATSVLHRGVLGGSELTVETAARGSSLTAYLQVARAGPALAVAERVLTWVGALGRRTRHLDDVALGQLGDRVLAAYGAQRLAARLAGLSMVLTHQDLGSWNVLTDGSGFTVVDWESAAGSGLPLADTCYLATDVLTELHGPRAEADRAAWCIRLWAGELPASALLRAWVTAAAGTAGLPAEAVPALVTTGWLHHGLSQAARAALTTDGVAAAGYLGRLAPRWVADARLGLDWAGFAGWPAR